ncbi:MAG: glycoside hydrolase family 95 protein [Clostridia bacterium]|nr:glycoside hydrolase family 95 protein [Clostridia bacterium]
MRIKSNVLWYRSPANIWTEALPLGNGRIGAMEFGGAEDMRIQMNEDTLWTGKPSRYENPGAQEALKKARKQSLAGDQHAAQETLEQEFCKGLWSQMYMPLCDVQGHFDLPGDVTDYSRKLDMQSAVHTVRFKAGNVQFTRETFVSHPHQCMAVRITAEGGTFGMQVKLVPALKKTIVQAENNCLTLQGNCPVVRHTPGIMQQQEGASAFVYGETPEEMGMGYGARLMVFSDGKEISSADTIKVDDAAIVTLIFTGRTSFNGWDRHPVLAGVEYLRRSYMEAVNAAGVGYEALKETHIADHRALYDRIDLHLEGDEMLASLPTDERMLRHRAGEKDNGLYTLLFNHARYLTIAGSRRGTQPTNLQGIWNDNDNPPWHCNYTLNINTEMNYWPTLRMGLNECMEPMLRLVKELTESGTWTAQHYYGARGAVTHHNTDLWRMSTPVGAGCTWTAEFAFWPFGLMWLARSAWEHYLYTGDEKVLKEITYPALKASALFLLDTLVEDKGEWIFCPATSAEHWYILPDGTDCQVDRASGMMQQIARDTFEMCMAAEEALGISELSADMKEKLSRLKGLEKDGHGRIAEFDGDRPDGENEHRHVSHLYALFPAGQIDPDMPEWMDAVRKTLDMRGDESTGWAMAWRINLWARLRDGDRALKLLRNQLMLCVPGEENTWQEGGTYVNLFCAHPPFQIDGNFGAASGILEMLCQVEKDGCIAFLPALPADWANGEVRGLCLPGGEKLDMRWENGKLAEHRIYTV